MIVANEPPGNVKAVLLPALVERGKDLIAVDDVVLFECSFLIEQQCRKRRVVGKQHHRPVRRQNQRLVLQPLDLFFLVSEDHDRFAAAVLIKIRAQEHKANLFFCNIYIIIGLLRRTADVLLRVQKADGLRPEPRGIRPAACVVIALHREEASARNSGPEQRELLPQQKLCVPSADLTGEEITQMDAAVKMYRLIDCGDVLNGSRDGIVQMRVRNQRNV